MARARIELAILSPYRGPSRRLGGCLLEFIAFPIVILGSYALTRWVVYGTGEWFVAWWFVLGSILAALMLWLVPD